MENWRRVWRDGLAPLLSSRALESLRRALIDDNPRLLQGATTEPPPLECEADRPVTAACGLAYCGWTMDLETVAEVEEHFGQICQAADEHLGEPAACRYFLNWFDETPRDTMRRHLLYEVERALGQRRPALGGPRQPAGSAA